MNIKSLKLNHFRNYQNLHVDFDKNFNIIYGDNAQGKTNILEAIFLCSSGRSHRVSKDTELLKFGEKYFFVKAVIERDVSETVIEIGYERDGKKKVKINDIPTPKIGSLMGNLNTVIFSPENLNIIKEGPSERRRFIDITLSQIRPTYFYDLQQYSKALIQRNSLLKEIQKNKSLVDTIEVWNQNLASIGARIIKVRSEFVKRLAFYAERNHMKLTNHQEILKFEYSPSVKCSSYTGVHEIEETFFNLLQSSLKKEIVMETTLYGPQRDDYTFHLNGLNIKSFGSQGQQRTVVLSMKLSEVDVMKEESGEFPVVLLDDVMSELDYHRQEYLFESLQGIQTIITCTIKEFFASRISDKSSFIHVVGGEVVSHG